MESHLPVRSPWARAVFRAGNDRDVYHVKSSYSYSPRNGKSDEHAEASPPAAPGCSSSGGAAWKTKNPEFAMIQWHQKHIMHGGANRQLGERGDPLENVCRQLHQRSLRQWCMSCCQPLRHQRSSLSSSYGGGAAALESISAAALPVEERSCAPRRKHRSAVTDRRQRSKFYSRTKMKQ